MLSADGLESEHDETGSVDGLGTKIDQKPARIETLYHRVLDPSEPMRELRTFFGIAKGMC